MQVSRCLRLPQRRLRDLQGQTPVGRDRLRQYQDTALSEDEKRLGLALFCCAKPLSDIAIECREVGA